MRAKPLLRLALPLLIGLSLLPSVALADPAPLAQQRVVVFEIFTRST
jgi:hypothetical protein